MKFNINDHVRVKLTDHGRAVHAADHAMLCAEVGISIPYDPPSEDADGWSKWQLWVLMEAFGRHMGNGMNLVFQNEIEIITLPDAGAERKS